MQYEHFTYKCSTSQNVGPSFPSHKGLKRAQKKVLVEYPSGYSELGKGWRHGGREDQKVVTGKECSQGATIYKAGPPCGEEPIKIHPMQKSTSKGMSLRKPTLGRSLKKSYVSTT